MKKKNMSMVAILLLSQLTLPANIFAVETGKDITAEDKTASPLSEVTQSSDVEENKIIDSVMGGQLVVNEEVKPSTTEDEVIDLAPIVTLDDVDISASSNTVNSEEEPLADNGLVYSFLIKNGNVNGGIIPKGSRITLTLSSVDMSIDELVSTNQNYLANNTSSPNLYNLVSYVNGVATVETTRDIYPGTSSFNLTFVRRAGVSTNDGGVIPVTLSGIFTLNSVVGTDVKNIVLAPSTIYIQTLKKASGGGGGVVSVPGFSDFGALTSSESNYLGSKLGNFGQFDGSRLYNGSPYMTFATSWVKGYVSNNRVVLWGESDHAIPKENYKVYTNSGGVITDLTDTESFIWEYSDNGVKVDISAWSKTEAEKLTNGASVFLAAYIPVSSEDEVVSYTGSLGWTNYEKWTSPTLRGVFKNPALSIDIPYFRTVGDVTIYDSDTYTPMTGVNAYLNTTDITDKVIISDLGGYPESGGKPKAGIYTLHYTIEYTDESGQAATKMLERKITVLENKAMIDGQNLTIYEGDETPEISDFKATATDKDGNASTVSLNLNGADLDQAGVYPVILVGSNGLTKTVNLTVLKNKTMIDGQNLTIYEGDETPVVSDFKAIATDKAGNASTVSLDLNGADLNQVGVYPVILVGANGLTKTVDLTVLENKATIDGQAWTMYTGDKAPVVSDFKATATDKAGNASTVNLDLDGADFNQAGVYPVILVGANGLTKTVDLTVLENKATIDGHGLTMYVGDKAPVVSNFKAIATDKDGNVSTVILDLNGANLNQAGVYPVILVGSNGLTKTVDLTVLEQGSGESSESGTGSGNKSVEKASDPKLPITGENSSNLFTFMGLAIMALILNLRFFVQHRSKKNK